MERAEYQSMFLVEQTHWWFVARRLFLQTIFSRVGIVPGKKYKIVDIGAGTGGMMPFLSQYGHVVGVEPNSTGRALAKKRKILLGKGTASKTGLQTCRYDIVCFFDVLYHKRVNEQQALREAYRLLKPGGWLVINDCAYPYLSSQHDVSVHGARRYTASSLLHIVEKQRFVLQYCTYMFFTTFPLFVLWRLLHKHMFYPRQSGATVSDVGKVPKWINRSLLQLCRVERRGYASLSYPWGSSVLLIAQKPAY